MGKRKEVSESERPGPPVSREGRVIRFVSSALLGEIGRIDEVREDGNCVVTIMEGPHRRGRGLYNPAEFQVLPDEELEQIKATEEEREERV